jgi:hypothetical protein
VAERSPIKPEDASMKAKPFHDHFGERFWKSDRSENLPTMGPEPGLIPLVLRRPVVRHGTQIADHARGEPLEPHPRLRADAFVPSSRSPIAETSPGLLKGPLILGIG